MSGSISNCNLVYLWLLAFGEKFGWVKVKTYTSKGDNQISWHKYGNVPNCELIRTDEAHTADQISHLLWRCKCRYAV
jgi:hypothetical protein